MAMLGVTNHSKVPLRLASMAGFAISVLCIYVLVTVSGFLPTRLATRVQPFEALRHE